MRLSSPNVFEDMLIQTPVVVSISPILFFLGRKEVQFNTQQYSKKKTDIQLNLKLLSCSRIQSSVPHKTRCINKGKVLQHQEKTSELLEGTTYPRASNLQGTSSSNIEIRLAFYL